MPKFATIEATQSLAESFPELSYRRLGRTELMVSEIGFGTYRLESSNPFHYQTFKQALLSGINLVDTSPNYGDGGVEELIGYVIQELIKRQLLTREQLVIVSKAGYLQGKVYEKHIQTGYPYPDLVDFAEGMAYCLTPQFLEEQITLSLKRLKLNCIDCYLLHNPEYYLNWHKTLQHPISELRESLYTRIKNVFIYLETEVKRGRIASYGVSSNTFGLAKENRAFLSVERLWQIAASIQASHFSVIETPINLLEPQGVLESNQAGNRGVITFAEEQDIGTLVNRPLKVFFDQKYLRLTEYTISEEASENILKIDPLLKKIVEQEQRFMSLVVTEEEDSWATKIIQLKDRLVLGEELNSKWKSFHSYSHWKGMVSDYLLPKLEEIVSKVVDVSDTEYHEWLELYIKQLKTVLYYVGEYYKIKSNEFSLEIKKVLHHIDRHLVEGCSLNQIAINALRSTKGVSSVLLGMSSTPYVEDALAILTKKPDFGGATDFWSTLARELPYLKKELNRVHQS